MPRKGPLGKNWKLIIENYIGGFYEKVNHRFSNRVIDIDVFAH